MYLIVGLGNPEEDYARTRHNMGFDAINKIAEIYNININKKKFSSLYGSVIIGSNKVILVKPQTFMNLSGQAVREFVNFYKIENENIIILYDDMDVEKGTIKIRKKGGSGSHNGMKSIVQELSSEDFPRIRIGIGKPKYKNDMINYVLGFIPDEEYNMLQKGVEKASLAVKEIIQNGIDIAMNKYN